MLGVTRKNGRGLPKCIEQVDVTKKEYLVQTRGNLKVAEIVGEAKALGIISMSIYDTKPVYLMSVACEEIKWLNKDLKLVDKTQHTMVAAPFYRVNVIDDYNQFMGNVDIADQLRGSYRFDHWMLKRKWWWSMLFWAFQVLLTN